MTTTANLNVTNLTVNQNNPDVVENEAKAIFDAAIAGALVHNMASDADNTLDTATGAAPFEWQNAVINVTDSGVLLTVTRNIITPDYNKVYIFKNDTAQSLVLKTSAGTGITVATLKTAVLYCDGTNVIRITADA